MPIKKFAFHFINSTRIQIMYDVKFNVKGPVKIIIRSQNDCQSKYVDEYVTVNDSSIDKVQFEMDLQYELTTYLLWMFVNDTIIRKGCQFISMERPFNEQIIQNSSFHIDETSLHLFLENNSACRNASHGYHHKYQIETLPKLQISFQDEGLFVFTNDDQKSDKTVIVKAIDSIGQVRDGKIFIIPKKSDILPPPKVHTKSTSNTCKVTWIQPYIKEVIVSFTLYWCKAKDNDKNKLCDGSIKSKILKATDFEFTILSKETALRIAVAVNSEQSSSGIKFIYCLKDNMR